MSPDSVATGDTTTQMGMPWLVFARHRAHIRGRWPSLWRCPVVVSPFASVDRSPGSVLDVGATSREWESEINRRWPAAVYASLDIDRTMRHDYHAFEEVDRRFDLVLCLEVLEHLPISEVAGFAASCVSVLRPGGLLVASVPNVHAIGIQHELTHVTAFGLHDLPALLTVAGAEPLHLARWWRGGSRRRFLMHHWPLRPLHHAIGVDYCQSVLVTARRPGAPAAQRQEPAPDELSDQTKSPP